MPRSSCALQGYLAHKTSPLRRDPTVEPCLGPCGGPRGVDVFFWARYPCMMIRWTGLAPKSSCELG